MTAHSGFDTQRRCLRKSKTEVPVAPKYDMCPPKGILSFVDRKNRKLCLVMKTFAIGFYEGGKQALAIRK